MWIKIWERKTCTFFSFISPNIWAKLEWLWLETQVLGLNKVDKNVASVEIDDVNNKKCYLKYSEAPCHLSYIQFSLLYDIKLIKLNHSNFLLYKS